MEVLGYFFIALAAPIAVAAICFAVFVFSPRQRAKPSLFLVISASSALVAAIVFFTSLVTFLGAEAVSGFTVGLLAATIALSGPVIVKAVAIL